MEIGHFQRQIRSAVENGIQMYAGTVNVFVLYIAFQRLLQPDGFCFFLTEPEGALIPGKAVMSDPDKQKLFGQETEDAFVVVVVSACVNSLFQCGKQSEQPVAVGTKECPGGNEEISHIADVAADDSLKIFIIFGVQFPDQNAGLFQVSDVMGASVDCAVVILPGLRSGDDDIIL